MTFAEHLDSAVELVKSWPEWKRRALREALSARKGDDVLGEIINERKRQDDKWGEQNHQPSIWLVILGEEVGEACKAVLEMDCEEYRKELIQVAAVAIAAVESYDRSTENEPKS